MAFPELQNAKELTKHGNVIPVSKSIFADTETPVSAWMKLFRDAPYSFLLESVSGEDSVARYSFLGGNPFLVFSSMGKEWSVTGQENYTGSGNPFDELRKLLGKYNPVHVENLPRFTGGAVGFFSYDTIRLWEKIPDKNPKLDPLKDIIFGFYQNIVAFDNREHRLILISNIVRDENIPFEEQYEKACATIQAMESKLSTETVTPTVNVNLQGDIRSNFKQQEYEEAVKKCKEYIKAGDIFQIVLSQRFEIPVDAKPFDLYRVLRIVNPSPYMYYLSLNGSSVIGASPEMLARVENNTVEVRPIAGTRRRGKDDAEDEKLITELKADPKEIAEHVMLVDLGRNDVGRVSEYGSVHVEDMMHIEKYSHVIHIVSNVKGTLKKGVDPFTAMFSCFPAGTLSGAPKIRAMEIIDELEPVKRGLYGGALGYIDFNGQMDTCIVIRTIVYNNGIAMVQAGAGIVADSVPEHEYNETVHKATALFTAIRKAAGIGAEQCLS